MPVPTGVAPTYHWYEGDAPPLVGVAVNVTEVPTHTGLALATTDTLTGSKELTIMVMPLEMAGLPERQVRILDVN